MEDFIGNGMAIVGGLLMIGLGAFFVVAGIYMVGVTLGWLS